MRLKLASAMVIEKEDSSQWRPSALRAPGEEFYNIIRLGMTVREGGHRGGKFWMIQQTRTRNGNVLCERSRLSPFTYVIKTAEAAGFCDST